MDLRPYLHIAPEVEHALSAGRPVLALPTTDFACCLTTDQSLALAEQTEQSVRAAGAVPAAVAGLDGALPGCG